MRTIATDIEELKKLRAAATTAMSAAAAAEVALLARPEWVEVEAKRLEYKTAQARVDALEKEIKQHAVERFEQNGDKHPHASVSIQERTSVEMTDPEAFARWALANDLDTINISPKKKPVGSQLRAGTKIPGVKLEDKPIAVISSKL